MSDETYNELVAAARRVEEILKAELEDFVDHEKLINDSGYILMIAVAKFLEYK